MYRLNNFFLILFFLIPLSLITGPAIPDITITFTGVFGLTWLFIIKKRYDLFNDSFINISLLFWLGLIFISFFAFNKEKSFQDSIIYLRFLFIPICCYYIFFKDEKNLKYLLLIILVLVLFVLIDTLFQFFNYDTINGFGRDLLGFKSNWYGRLTGPFGDELVPGSYVSKFGLVGYVYLLLNNRLKYKILLNSSYLSLILIICFVSGERMAFATFLLAMSLLLFLLKNYRKEILLAIIFGLTIIFFIYKFHPFYNDFEVIESNEYHQGLKIEKKFECKDNKNETCTKIINIQPSFLKIISNFSTTAYGEIYYLSYKMFRDNPITGIGISNFKSLCIKNENYKKLMVNYDCASHPHNTYLQWLTEGGIIIFFLFIIYLFFITKKIIRNNGSKDFKIISIVLLIILFWPIMSTGSLIKNWYGIFVYFIIGISLCLSRLKKNY